MTTSPTTAAEPTKDQQIASLQAQLEALGVTPKDLKHRDGDQAVSIPNGLPGVQGLVIKDIQDRIKVGVERYGTPLQPFNGRSAFRDAYEEALDLAVYMRSVLATAETATAEVEALLAEQIGTEAAAIAIRTIQDRVGVDAL